MSDLADRTTIYLGPPGTGKTHSLLDVMESEMRAGVRSKNIGYVAFTKKAAQVAKERAISQFGLKDEDLPYFRTLHSLAFRQLGLKRDQVMQRSHYRELGDKLGMDLRSTKEFDGVPYGMSKEERLVFVEGLSRVKGEDLRKTWEDADEDEIDWWELERYSRALVEYKASRMVLDYTDMIRNFVEQSRYSVPDLDVLIIDETQDLSSSQWEMVGELCSKAKRIYYAGDDDQCSVAGSLVDTTVGKVLVEDLDPANHRLVSWSLETQSLDGNFEFAIARSRYEGLILVVECGGSRTRCTPDHLWYVRFKGSSLVFEIEARNVTSGMMEIPLASGGWAQVDLVEEEWYEGDVFSLNVEPHHTYVVDGLVTKNCLFHFAGADVQRFIDLKGKVKVLSQSYRLPSSVHQLAVSVTDQISNRRPKAYYPKGSVGEVKWYAGMDEVDLRTGNWLLLARNGYMLTELEEMCVRDGFSFESVGSTPLKSDSLKAIRIWEALRKGRSVTVEDASKVARFASPGMGIHKETRDKLKNADQESFVDMAQLRSRFGFATEKIWHEALDRISEKEREFFIAARKRDETLTNKPRIMISTIHSAKGSEADNVLLMTDVSYRTFVQMNKNPDDEYRTWYVGVSRAAERLHIVVPQTNLGFEF